MNSTKLSGMTLMRRQTSADTINGNSEEAHHAQISNSDPTEAVNGAGGGVEESGWNAPSGPNSRALKTQIDENLRRVYESTLKQDIPDRFKDLLAQLKSGTPPASLAATPLTQPAPIDEDATQPSAIFAMQQSDDDQPEEAERVTSQRQQG